MQRILFHLCILPPPWSNPPSYVGLWQVNQGERGKAAPRNQFPVDTMNIHAPQWLPVSRQTTNLTSHFFSPPVRGQAQLHTMTLGVVLQPGCILHAKRQTSRQPLQRAQSSICFNFQFACIQGTKIGTCEPHTMYRAQYQ